MSVDRIAIGTRGSNLALAQARLVAAALEREGRASRLVVVETTGDRRAPDTAWGEGAFVAEIERALLDGRVDVAVHSAKDVPTDEDDRLTIGAYLPRADPRDALVLPHGAAARRVADLPAGSRVGTDSPRRAGFLRAGRPDLQVHPLHGNVDTRLRRLDDGETDALILACAGLDRLGLGERITQRLDPEIIPPAPGQGAIALQVRRDDARTMAVTAALDDRPTRLAVEAERWFLRTCGGGCRSPIGALGTIVDETLDLLGGHASVDGSTTIVGRRRGAASDGLGVASRLAADLDGRSRLREGLDDGAHAEGRRDRPRVLVTRAADQSGPLARALEGSGLDPVLVPAIDIQLEPPGGDLDRAARTLHDQDWVVVTSPNGARAVLEAAQRVRTELGVPRWAAIGEATAAVLERQGIDVAFRPSRGDAVAMATELPVAPGGRVLVIRGDLADRGLVERLRERGADAQDVVAYRTIEAPAGSGPLLGAAIAAGAPDAVVFTSGSTVRGLRTLAQVQGTAITAIPAVCIGPETAGEARRAGFSVLAIAPHRDALALARTVAHALIGPKELTS